MIESGTIRSPKSSMELYRIVFNEQFTEKFYFVEQPRVLYGCNKSKDRKGQYWYNTTDIQVYFEGRWYNLTKKTYLNKGFSSTSGKEWPIDFVFEKVQKKIWNRADLSPYLTNMKYTNCCGNGWSSQEILYLRDGIYYADLNC